MAACGGNSGKGVAGPTTVASTPTSVASVPTTSAPAASSPTTARAGAGTVPSTTPAPLAEQPLGPTALRDTANMEPSFDKATINGVSYTSALFLRPSSSVSSSNGSDRRVEIDAGRSHKRFIGDLGIPDTQKSNAAYKVEISLDSAAAVFSTEVRFGETKKVDLDITNALRIKIVVSPITCCDYLAIGSPRFV